VPRCDSRSHRGTLAAHLADHAVHQRAAANSPVNDGPADSGSLGWTTTTCGSEVVRTKGAATVLLGTLGSLGDQLVDLLVESVREVGVHAEALGLDGVLDFALDDDGICHGDFS